VPRPSYTPTTYMLLILMFLLMPTWCRPQTAGSAVDPVSVAVTQVLNQQQTAWNQGDIPSFMQGYWKSPELSFSGSSGVSRGWQAVLARYQLNYPNKSAMGHLEFSDLEVQLLGDSAALVLGKWHLKRDSGDIGGVFTLVFQRFPEGWKIIHDHTSQVQPGKP
jgi:ketosteroid isomerase-like protein